MTVQKSFGLPVLKDYSLGYATLVSKLIWLQIASVSKKEIQTQLNRERKLLQLLKVDSDAPGSTWFEDGCKDNWDPGALFVELPHPGQRHCPRDLRHGGDVRVLLGDKLSEFVQ